MRLFASLIAAPLEEKLCTRLRGSSGFFFISFRRTSSQRTRSSTKLGNLRGSARFSGEGTLNIPTEHSLQALGQKMHLRIFCWTCRPEAACPFTIWCLITSPSVPTLNAGPLRPLVTFLWMYRLFSWPGMSPTILLGDRVELAYRFRSPLKRG